MTDKKILGNMLLDNLPLYIIDKSMVMNNFLIFNHADSIFWTVNLL